MYLFKRLSDDRIDSPLQRQVVQMLQSLTSELITSTVYTDINGGGIIAIPIIKCTFDNDYTHILHDPSKK